jgi:hypothetical protein
MGLVMSRTARAELPNCLKWWHCTRTHGGSASISSPMPAAGVKRRLPSQSKGVYYMVRVAARSNEDRMATAERHAPLWRTKPSRSPWLECILMFCGIIAIETPRIKNT